MYVTLRRRNAVPSELLVKNIHIWLICVPGQLWKPGQQTFCNFSQLPLSNSFFTVLFAYFVFACFVVIIRDLCRSGWRQNYYLTIDRITIFANYLSCYVSLNQALFCCSSLNFKISRLKWTRFRKLCEVRLLNRCSKICFRLNLDFKGPLAYCPASDKGF